MTLFPPNISIDLFSYTLRRLNILFVTVSCSDHDSHMISVEKIEMNEKLERVLTHNLGNRGTMAMRLLRFLHSTARFLLPQTTTHHNSKPLAASIFTQTYTRKHPTPIKMGFKSFFKALFGCCSCNKDDEEGWHPMGPLYVPMHIA
jgi:hypothetical protein